MADLAFRLAVIIGFVLVVGFGVPMIIGVVTVFVFERPSREERAWEKVRDHAVQRSRQDAELRAGMHADAMEVRRQLRQELGDR